MSARKFTLAGLTVLCAMISTLALASVPALALKEYASAPGSPFGGEGSGDGQFTNPAGVAVNDSIEPLLEPAAGDVYVADEGSNRIERFSPSGAFIAAWGWGVSDGEEKYEVCTSGCRAGLAGSGAGQFSSPEGVAVDDSGNALDPSLWDVYVADNGNRVIDTFSASGEYKRQLTGTCAVGPCAGEERFGTLHGVAIDPSGNVWVYQGYEPETNEVDEFSDTGSFIRSFKTGLGAQPGMAVDPDGNVYVVDDSSRIFRFHAATGQRNLSRFSTNVTGLAIDPATGGVLVDSAGSIALYGPSPTEESVPLQTFPAESLAGSGGLAVGPESVVYASDLGGDDVAFFEALLFPVVSTQAATGIMETSATLRGSVNPEGDALTDCHFEYGLEASYGASIPCAQSSAEIGEGSQPVSVSADVTGLQLRSRYHFRLVVANANGAREGEDETFFTSAAPVVEDESLSNVTSVGATVSARVNAAGLPTGYHVEYVSEAQFTAGGFSGASAVPVPDAALGAPREGVGVQVQLSGLQPGTAYRLRLVASNARGGTAGAAITFTTAQSAAASSLSLPDERAYELVSPLGNGEVYLPETNAGGGEGGGDAITVEAFRAAADGDAMAYDGAPPGSGVGGNGNQGSEASGNVYLASRAEDGWAASDILPPPNEEHESELSYQGFSSDLSRGYFKSPDQPPLAGAPVCGVAPDGYQGSALYSRKGADGSFATLFTSTLTPEDCGRPLFAGSSADGSHVLFQSEAALISPAIATAGLSFGIRNVCEFECNLYESVGGVLSLVNVLPGGEVSPSAMFGGPPSLNGSNGQRRDQPDFSGAISADGSRVFWSDLSTGVVYVREDGVRTVQVSAGSARFWTASVNGRYAFYSEGEKLLRFDVEGGTREELAGAGAGVQGVVGTSEDGSYVYFVADGALAPGAGQGTCHELETEEEENVNRCDLYVLHVGEPVRFIARLAAEDNNIKGDEVNIDVGDWQPGPGYRLAEVTPGGQGLVFGSILPLTGYDNHGLPEVFVYEHEAGGGQLSCASCNPSGAPPSEERPRSAGNGLGAFLTTSLQGTYALRSISDNGSRVFFNTAQPLVARDSNGLVDVYEWERQGTEGCQAAGGCVYLLSGGTSSDDSLFLDASANGSDVFFVTRARLVSEDRDENLEVYDARAPHVPGETVGFPRVTPAVCLGTDCRGVPPAPQVFGAPASVTFSGAGNLAAPAPAVKHKPRSKAKKKVCRRGLTRRHGRCVKAKAKAPTKAKAPVRHAKKGSRG